MWRWIWKTNRRALLCGVLQGWHVVLRPFGLGKLEKLGSNSWSYLIRYDILTVAVFPTPPRPIGLHYTSLCCPHWYTLDLLTWPRFVVSHRLTRRTGHRALFCGVVQGCHVVLRSSGLGEGEKPGSNSRCHLIRCGYVNCYSFSNSTETFDLHYTSVFCLHCSTSDLLTWPRFVVSHRVILKFYFLCILFFIELIVVAFSRLAVFQDYELAKKYLLPAIDLRVNE